MSTPYTPDPSKRTTFITPGSGSASSLAQSDLSRMLPRQMSTGSLRGTQTVGYGQTKIDGSNNRITLGTGITLDGNSETITVSEVNKPILSMGKNTDNTFNFRVIDANGIGLAQFGQFPGGKIALRVAKAGVEVSTASPAELVFSSDASFTIAKSGTFVFPSQMVTAGTTVYATSQIIPHGAPYVPAINCFAPLEVGGASLPVYPPDFPTTASTFIPNAGLIYQDNLVFMSVYYGTDEKNIYLGMGYINDTGGDLLILGAPVTYYAYTYNAA